MFLENYHQDKENQKKYIPQKRLSLPNELVHQPLKENTNQSAINRNKSRHTDFPFSKDDKYFDEGKEMKIEKMEKIEEEEVCQSRFGSVIEEKQKDAVKQEVVKVGLNLYLLLCEFSYTFSIGLDLDFFKKLLYFCQVCLLKN